MVSPLIDFELYIRLVYIRLVHKCIDCSEPSGVGCDPSRLCHLHVNVLLFTLYIYLCALAPLPCPLRPLCAPHVPQLALPVRSHTST